MLRPRVIPSLLVHDNGLVKTVNFKNPKYVGDPINAVKIFNEKEVDELAVFDIDATVLGKEPNYSLIERLASQSMMPLCYGGGVKTVEQAQRIFSLGIEKIALSSAVLQNPKLITEISDRVGAQSVIVVLDVKKKLLGGYEVYTHNGKKATGINPFKFVEEAQKLGAGEINCFGHNLKLRRLRGSCLLSGCGRGVRADCFHLLAELLPFLTFPSGCAEPATVIVK